jgi:hypothetical protein
MIAPFFGIPACIIGARLTHEHYHNAAIGAMISDIILEVGLAIAYWSILRREVGVDRKSVLLFFRMVLASVPMALILLLLPHLLPIVRVILSVLTFAVGVIVFKVIDREMLQMVREMIKKRG